MDNKKLSEKLARLLQAIEQGELTLEEALTRNPEQRAELEPLLRTALKLWELRLFHRENLSVKPQECAYLIDYLLANL